MSSKDSEDIGSIFGRKKRQRKRTNSLSNPKNSEELRANSVVGTSDGIPTVKTDRSVEEYFAEKMKKIASRCEDEADESSNHKKRRKNKKKKIVE